MDDNLPVCGKCDEKFSDVLDAFRANFSQNGAFLLPCRTDTFILPSSAQAIKS